MLKKGAQASAPFPFPPAIRFIPSLRYGDTAPIGAKKHDFIFNRILTSF